VHAQLTGRLVRVLLTATAAALLVGAAAQGSASSDSIAVNLQTFSDLACYGGNGGGHVLTCWRTTTGFSVVLPEFKPPHRPFIDTSVRGRKVLPIAGKGVTLMYRKSWRSPNGDFTCKSSNSLFMAHLLCSNRNGKGFDLGPLTYATR
jgi:hypothetical protein